MPEIVLHATEIEILRQQLSDLGLRCYKLEEENKELRKEIFSLREQLSDSRQMLEDERG